MPYSELGNLNPVVVRHVYFRNDDENRTSIPPAVAHRHDCETRGMTEEEIQDSWRKRLDEDPGLREIHQ